MSQIEQQPEHQLQPQPEETAIPKPASSPRKLASARANGAKSHGPTTPEGLAICATTSKNFRHGMLAQTVVLASESRDRFEALVEEYLAEYHPATKSERDLVETLAAARWRMLRVLCVQKTDFDLEVARHQSNSAGTRHSPPVAATLAFRSLSDKGNSLGITNRYETSYERQYHRALRELKKIAAERKRNHETVPDQPITPKPWEDCSNTFDNQED